MVFKKNLLILALLIMLPFRIIIAQTINQQIGSLIHKITKTTYIQHFDSLKTNNGCFRKVTESRYQSKDHDNCRDYIFRYFQKYFGENNSYIHHFEIENKGGLANVLAYKEGKYPWKGIIVISAHYDTNNGRVEDSFSESAPGANDNGTGLAALLEIARVLSSVETNRSILFAAWDSEENMYEGYPTGSNHWYSDKVKNRKKTDWIDIGNGGLINIKNIIADINFDMLGNPQDTVYGKPLLWACTGHVIHEKFVNDYVETFDLYVPEIKVINNGKMIFSDHYTFASRKIPAVENLESNYYDDPYYHTSSDYIENSENVDLNFAVSVTRGGFAFILKEAGLYLHRSDSKDFNEEDITFSEYPDRYCLISAFSPEMIVIYDYSGEKVAIQKVGVEYFIHPGKSGYYFIYITDYKRYSVRKIYLQEKELNSFY